MGAELGERKKQETTEEVNKPAEKSKGVAGPLSHLDAPAPLAPKSIIVYAEKNKQKVGEPFTAMDAPALLPSKYINVYVRKYINVYVRRNRRKRGKPSTAMDSPAPLENSMDIDLNVEPEENMQQDDHVDVSQTQDPVEVSNAGCMQGPEVKEAKKRGRPPRESFDKKYSFFKHRCVPKIIGQLNESLNPDQHDEVKESAFASMLGIKLKEETIPEKFASYLVDKVNTETEELELGENREVKIKLANVIEMVMGLKNEGEEIPLGKLLDGRKTSKPFRKRSRISGVTADGRSRGPHVQDFQAHLKEPEKELTFSTYASMVLCCIVCPNSSQNVDARLLEYVSSLDKMNKYNWCEFVLRYLIQAIKNLKKGILHSLYGNMLMLVAIFLDMAVDRKMPKGFPRTSVIVDDDIRWLKAHYGRWDKLKLKKFSASIYGDKYVENKEGETSRSKEDGDVSQMDRAMLSEIIKSAEEGSDISAQEKLDALLCKLKLLQNQSAAVHSPAAAELEHKARSLHKDIVNHRRTSLLG